MPRFSLKTLLIVFAIVALWLSTFSEYPGSEDVRAFIMLACIIASGVAAYGCTTRRRAFWLGFFGAMLMLGTRVPISNFGAKFQWAIDLSRNLPLYFGVNPGGRGRLVLGINTTVYFVVMLIVATVVGLLCVYVYDQCRKLEDR